MRNTRKEQLDTATTIPGACSYHQFEPLDHEKVKHLFYLLLSFKKHASFFLDKLYANSFLFV